MSSPATSAQIPAGPDAKTSAGTAACSRHPFVDGPRLCRTCNNPLCTACVRDVVHASCPSCSRKHGLAPWRVDVGWLRWLVVDAALTALPTLHKSALPLVAVVLAVIQVRGPDAGAWLGAGLAGSVGEVALNALLLGSMATGMRGVPPPWKRVWRAWVVMLAGGVVLAVPSMLLNVFLFSRSASYTGAEGMPLMLLGWFSRLPWLLLGSTLVVMQAAAALRNDTLLRSLMAPYASGFRPWVVVTSSCCLVLALGWPITVFSFTTPGVATPLLAALGCVRQFLQAAVGVGCLRYLMDARTARGDT